MMSTVPSIKPCISYQYTPEIIYQAEVFQVQPSDLLKSKPKAL